MTEKADRAVVHRAVVLAALRIPFVEKGTASEQKDSPPRPSCELVPPPCVCSLGSVCGHVVVACVLLLSVVCVCVCVCLYIP